ncbi:MAG TPA: BON domain-containing protein [Gammaproteobacteria bacterium]|nr:BON domain-containing protein [Gammaproteobacteria bacterium]
MKKLLVLLLGAIALALLIWLCLGRHVPAIEKDLINCTADSLNRAGIDWAKVGISGRDVTLSGVAPSAELRVKAEEIARSSCSGVRTVDNAVTVAQPAPAVAPPSPYEMNFVLEDGDVVISGMVPDEETRESVIQAAGQRVGADRVQDRLQIVAGAPAGWREAAVDIAASLDQFSRMNAAVVDTNVRVTGTVDSEATRSQVEQSLSAGLPNGFSHRWEIAVPESRPVAEPEPEPVAAATGCQQRFNELLARQSIHFRTSSARISKRSYPLLDELAQVASECPEARIRIEGHTDSRGSERFNLNLSQARAESVVRYLIGKGVAASRLEAVGYGESRPVADNGTAAGRARNRRIEFNVNLQGN